MKFGNCQLPFLTPWEHTVSFIGSLANILPGLLALLAGITRRRSAFRALATCLDLFAAVYALCEICYLQHRTPLRRWLLLPIIALLTPLQVLWSLLSNEEIEWRGQRMRIRRGGQMEVLP